MPTEIVIQINIPLILSNRDFYRSKKAHFVNLGDELTVILIHPETFAILIVILGLNFSGCGSKSPVPSDAVPITVINDYGNNRVLLWNSVPKPGQLPDVVLGQPDFVSSTANNGGVSASSLRGGGGVFVDQKGHLIVADSGNNRVLIWNQIPTRNKQPADIVLGQPDMFSTSVNAGAGASSPSNRTVSGPNQISGNGFFLLVNDSGNNRNLIWKTFPTTNQQAADLVIGQPNMNTTNGFVGVSPQSMCSNQGLVLFNQKIFATDGCSNRILGFSSIPFTNGPNADVVIGQSDFTGAAVNAGSGSINASGLNYSYLLASDGFRFLAADFSNFRVMLWNSIPSSNHQPCDVVIGQPSKTVGVANNGGVSLASISNPGAIGFDGTNIIVGDPNNNRFLVWNSVPLTDGVPADYVLGQPDAISTTANNGGVSGTSLSGAWSVYLGTL